MCHVIGLSFFIIFLFNSIEQVEGSIHDYKNEYFIPQSNAFFFHGGSEGLYASKVSDQSSSSDKGYKGRSFIRFESITFTRTKESAEKQNEWQQYTGLVEAIIVEVKDRERIGGTYLKTDAICCNQTLANEGHCKVGEVIMQTNPGNRGWPKRIKIFFEGKNEKATKSESVDIEKTGMYYLYFMYCDPTLKGTTISGRTVWKNPDGYLPGKMTPLMKFYGFMSLAYLLLGLGWLLRFVRFWKDIIQLHYHITAVIALGMLEMALWFLTIRI
ncbi:Transmembrane protein 87B [Bienertia sinuspersici]